ncbi:MobF family relaxase [Pandoraea sputorum]
MISMTHISGAGVADSARYFDRSFSQDGVQRADSYYINEVAAAQWQGRGAEILGIQGEGVERKEFIELLSGKIVNPDTGEIQDLADNSKGKDRRAGMDFTVSPPKSVSIAGLVGNDQRVVDAHLKANATAMRWLEKHAAVIRVKDERGRNKSVLANNLLYATVLHETNRENEPQIHSHNVIVSAVYDENDKKWRSLTNDDMLNLRAQADKVYKAELAHGLKALGYALDHAENGVDFEISGFSQEQIDLYATRKAQMEAALIARNINPAEASYAARQAAALDSRSAKNELPRDVLQEVWRETARDAGLDVANIVEVARENARALQRAQNREDGQTVEHERSSRGQPSVERSLGDSESGAGDRSQSLSGIGERVGQSDVTPPHLRVPAAHERDTAEGRGSKPGLVATNAGQQEALEAVAWAIEHLTEREQMFRLVDLELTALQFSRGTLGDVEWAVDQHVKNHLILERETDNAEMTYTTHRAIEAELRLAEWIRGGIGANHVVLSREEDFESALTAFESRKTQETGATFKLSPEQVESARNVLMHPDTFQGIQGDAGSGKTAALEMVREAAISTGWNVVGIATSAAAAKELGASSGIESDTVAGFFAKRDARIMATQLRLNELRDALRDSKAMRGSENLSTETRRLEVSNSDVDFGENRYTFDHQRGEVFRSPDNLRNAVGSFLTEIANKHRSLAQEAQAQAQTFSDHIRAGALSYGTSAAESLGRRLSQYEQVGTVEAVAARVSLYLSKNQNDDMAQEFARKQAELSNLQRFGNAEGRKTLLVMDESSLTGAYDTEKISELAHKIGARVVFQGDVKQHGSVAAGRAFKQAQESGMHVSVLEETRRFDRATPQTKRALQEMKAGNYAAAISQLDTLEVSSTELASSVAARYLENIQQLQARGIAEPKVGVVAITNSDRKEINASIHSLLAAGGHLAGPSFVKPHLDDPKLTKAEQTQVVKLREKKVDALIFRKMYREIGVKSGDVVSVVSFDVDGNRIQAKTEDGKIIQINPQRHDFFSPAKWETRHYAVGDLVETRGILRLPDQETKRIANGTRGVITEIDEQGAKVRWTREGKESQLSNKDIRLLDLAYAHTSYKEQGATNDREIIAVSTIGAKVFNKEAAYVAATRAKDNTEIVTSDLKKLMNNAGRAVDKTTAVEMTEVVRRENAKAGQQTHDVNIGRDKPAEKARDKGRLLEI